MAKIIVAFPDRELNRKIAEALETSGYEVFRTCMTGNEVMRAFNQCQDGILVCGIRFPDRTADALAFDLGDQAVILVIGKPEQLQSCEHPEIFRRPIPFTRPELLATIDILLQVHSHRMPRRSKAENEPVAQAKKQIMAARSLSEPQAHRLLQKYAMQHGLSMVVCASRMLDGTLSVSAVCPD